MSRLFRRINFSLLFLVLLANNVLSQQPEKETILRDGNKYLFNGKKVSGRQIIMIIKKKSPEKLVLQQIKVVKCVRIAQTTLFIAGGPTFILDGFLTLVLIELGNTLQNSTFETSKELFFITLAPESVAVLLQFVKKWRIRKVVDVYNQSLVNPGLE